MRHATVRTVAASPTDARSPGRAVVIAVITGVAVWHLLAHRLLPEVAEYAPGPWSWWTVLALKQTTWIAYGAGLVLVARSHRRRIVALALVTAGVTIDLLTQVAYRHLGDHPGFLIDLSRVTPYLLIGAVVAAWGVARRSGPWWPAGLLVSFGLLAYLDSGGGLSDYYAISSAIQSWLGAAGSVFSTGVSRVVAWLVGWILPILSGCIACWLIENYAARTTNGRAQP